jgi:hypothetical protein
MMPFLLSALTDQVYWSGGNENGSKEVLQPPMNAVALICINPSCPGGICWGGIDGVSAGN